MTRIAALVPSLRLRHGPYTPDRLCKSVESRGRSRSGRGGRGGQRIYCAPEPGCAVASVAPVAALILTSIWPADLSPLARFFL
jgi:hypothetical protein